MFARHPKLAHKCINTAIGSQRQSAVCFFDNLLGRVLGVEVRPVGLELLHERFHDKCIESMSHDRVAAIVQMRLTSQSVQHPRELHSNVASTDYCHLCARRRSARQLLILRNAIERNLATSNLTA